MRDPKLSAILFYQLEETIKVANRYTHRLFAEAGVDLTKDQFLVLKAVIDAETGIAPLQIAQTLFKDAASITRTLHILERKELLQRVPNPADRRSSLLVASARGEKVFECILPVVRGIRGQAVAGLSATEIETLERTLRTIRENMS